MVTAAELLVSRVFRDLSVEDIELILPLCNRKSFDKGSVMVAAGEPATQVFILQSGSVQLQAVRGTEFDFIPEPTVVSDLSRKGEMIGWSSLVPPHEYMLSAVSASDVEAVVIDGVGLRDLMASNTGLGYNVMKELAKAIRSRLARGFVS